MSTKHTPGPWEAAANKVYGPSQVRVATCGQDNHKQTTVTEDDANARFIAAAPDLLEALIKIRDGLKEGALNASALGAIARAAIAKAAGK